MMANEQWTKEHSPLDQFVNIIIACDDVVILC